MSKLAILGVLVGSLLGACVPYGQPYRSYGYHHWHHASWHRGYWNRGVYVDRYIYVDPAAPMPGVVIAPAPQTGVAVPAPQPQIAPPGLVEPYAP